MSASIRNITKYNKFNFSNYDFANLVRSKMYDSLVRFDVNTNQLFEQDEIKKALVQILNQNPNQVYYVVQNVFRYDSDNDRRITYEQFINFSVEQHFGEMAIQRLHKIQTYSRGKERIMNCSQFIKTLEYGLNVIGVYGSNKDYQRLFKEIDLDCDGWVTYSDYFIFLKEYFGTLRKQTDNKEKILPPVKIDTQAAGRFAKLIYSQLKILLMERDINRNLCMESNQVQQFLQKVFKVKQQQSKPLTNFLMTQRNTVGYEEFLQFAVPFYFCEYFPRRQNLNSIHISQQVFLQTATKASSIVAVLPAQKTLRSIFEMADSGHRGQLTLDQYVMVMGNIFQNFSFDRRGLSRSLY